MKALVVGDSGICGRHLVNYLLEKPQWSVCGISRGDQATAHQHLVADLEDPASLKQVLRAHQDISHVFYAGRAPHPDPQQEAANNTRMFCNLVESLDAVGTAVDHIQMLQGMKWYGSHVGAYRTPSRESDARHPSPNFYYDQHDWLLRHQINRGFTWSALRPHQVVGFSDRYPHNLAAVIALYGSFCKHLGEPFDFPGTSACFQSVSMITDAALLAEAMAYAATSPATANAEFNVGNGDYFRWANVWQQLADFFDVTCGDVNPHRLEERFDGADDVWRGICDRHGLVHRDMSSIGNWRYGDFTFQAGWDDMASFTAIRAAGFHGWRDSEQVLLDTLAEYRNQRVIP